MEKQKRWQYYLILAVIILTLYNILPTIFYYSNPLKNPIDSKRAENVATSIIERVNSLEDESQAWLASYSKMLGLNYTKIQPKQEDPGLIEVTFSNANDAAIFKRFLPRAGVLIPFVPAQLELYAGASERPEIVLVARQLDARLNPEEKNKIFHFTPKYLENGEIAPLYRELVYDRTTQLALGFAGPSKTAQQLSVATASGADEQQAESLLLSLAKEIVEVDSSLGKNSQATKRYFASFTQIAPADNLLQKFIAKAETIKASLNARKENLQKTQSKKQESGELLDIAADEQLSQLENQLRTLDSALSIVQKNKGAFTQQNPLTQQEIQTALATSEKAINAKEPVQILDLQGHNPFVKALIINWADDKILLQFHPDIDAIRSSEAKTEANAFLKEKLNHFLVQDLARASRLSEETILPDTDTFAVKLNTLTNTTSLLALDLGYLANKKAELITQRLNQSWSPSHSDLNRENYPILSYDQFKTLPSEQARLGLVIYAPAMYDTAPPQGFKKGSIYVIARNLDAIRQKYKQTSQNDENNELLSGINELGSLLQQNNFIGYPGSSFGIDPVFRKDYIFELDDYYSNLLKATREDFTVAGNKRYATLDFTDVEQRILTHNRIEDKIQEDLLKWKEEYNVAQVELNATSKYLVPSPTKNVYWENFKISFSKYFRGDDRKILKWGLDLSGGKTVRIGLRDHSNRPVTHPDDLHQAVNELYTRVNAMGVSERTIHIENNNIILDFPGSQGISAAELIKASAMRFHIVNEKFTPTNPQAREPLQQFLQNVWNEAVVTNRKDIESINLIAWQHLGADGTDPAHLRPISDAARQLYSQGLRLANPKDSSPSHAVNDQISSIARLKGDEFSEWEGQSHPLIVVFHNYALEGASLTNIQAGYDPSQGNILSFGVKRSYEQDGGSPREDFYAWTSQFAEDKIVGTPKEQYSQGRGWRMAVILNDQIISSPVLRAALRDGGTISGHFSQREINLLASDLKAGSLSFTPRILSEENVSPELGKEERTQGIVASLVAISLVVIAMVGYYHFAGLVASCAVLFNILIMWGVLQNLGAALTLPSIAGIVLTIGMAVDANVLVFERIREEFKISGRIASAIQAGYRKAFSAIVDSNITTIMAAFILIQFDSGPIKGFAVSLIVGIISSMFTSLFMTRYFFAGWVQKPENKTLTMSQFIGNTQFNFIAQAKKAIAISVIVMLVGTYFFVAQRKTLFGMDFTGGYSLQTELVENPNISSYRLATAAALESKGATINDFQIRELSRPNQLRIQFSMGMEEKGHPFYLLPEENSDGTYAYSYQRNPRIDWVVNALQEAGLQIVPSQLTTLENNWTVISGQLSDTMRNNAIIALTVALFSILIYITFRFEFKFAVASVIGLAHDVMITLGLLAILHWMGLPAQIDLQVIGAIMTIIGYSLNDTIIVFDRVREDMHILRKLSFSEIIDHALNVTLRRTIMTSGTTLLVLIALLLLGGKSIFAFSLVMTIGVAVGTISSLFIAAPVLLYLHNREIEQQQKAALNKTG